MPISDDFSLAGTTTFLELAPDDHPRFLIICEAISSALIIIELFYRHCRLT